ncbi:YqaA family protein [Motiliproteus sediminis]|uniref:YqaA family protein n=1 Tax=Motiliproteus sediminis TaxID=1468178 RepID=UPI001FE76874|nr:VTT domain-containing protein [Motiliproteus sediminis]
MGLSDKGEHNQSTSTVARWNRRVQRSRRALGVLFLASFAETLVIPIPIELIVLPFMATNRHRLWRTAAVVTLGCLVAALVGYGVGYLFYESIGLRLIEYFSWTQQEQQFRTLFDQYGFWAIVAVGILPIPFQVALLAAGASGYPLLPFIAAAALSRGLRYYALALLVYLVGDRAVTLWQDNKWLVSLGAAVIVALVLLLLA